METDDDANDIQLISSISSQLNDGLADEQIEEYFRAYLEVEDEETSVHTGSQLIIGDYWAWITTISDWIQVSRNEWRRNDYLVIVPCLTVLVDVIKLKLLMSELEVDDLETIDAIDSILDVINNNLPKICTLMTFPHITAIRRLLELILLTIKSTDNTSTISLLLSALNPYTTYLTSVLTNSTFSVLTSPTEYTGFFFSQRQSDDSAFIPYDAECLKRVIMIYMRSVEVFCDKLGNDIDEYAANEGIQKGIRCVLDVIEDIGLPSDQTVVEYVFRLFNNNDADMFDIMLSMTKLAIKKTRKKLEILLYTQPSLSRLTSCFVTLCPPHVLFLRFLQSTGFDHSILLDFLISNETRFLEFIVLYMRDYIGNDNKDYIENNEGHGNEKRLGDAVIKDFCRNQDNHEKGENVSRFLNMMVELRETTESLMRRRLFPYNARSLVQRIAAVEEALMM
ncbi:688_t:CDS:2 [Paraglomus occultum]|uniref:688_t:CDS:1 n=1 Tax=Paraglomus occultum TaxID=144539 RepID=A0A9N8Z8W9_9GLOM|nr:688_t:CDS:2 [Paraglomus occultum]